MVVVATHEGNGKVEVKTLIPPELELSDALVEAVAIQQSIVEIVTTMTDDKQLIVMTIEEMLKTFEGVLDKC